MWDLAMRIKRIREDAILRGDEDVFRAFGGLKAGLAVAEPKAATVKRRRRRKLATPTTVDADQWIMLETAARLAFPDGAMTVSSLRNEIRKGNLRAVKRAGKMFTTLNNIERMMRELCINDGAGADAKVRNSTFGKPSDPATQDGGSSSTPLRPASGLSAPLAALNEIAMALKKPSSDTSRKSMSRVSAKVIQLKS